VIIKPVTSAVEISGLLALDYDSLSPDGTPSIVGREPSFDGVEYVGGYVGEILAALMVFKKVSGGHNCHIATSPEYRSLAGFFARRVIANRGILFTSIPESHDHVIRFAERFGFARSKTSKDRWIKNGIESNIIIMRRD